jgi:hypothetical protein
MGESQNPDPRSRVTTLEAMASQARTLERNLSDYLHRHRIGDPTALHEARKHFIEGRNHLLRIARRIEQRHGTETVIPPDRWRRTDA